MDPITMMALFAGARFLFKWLDSDDGRQTVAAVASVALLAWRTVNDWLSGNRVTVGDSGSLIKQSLANGNFRVVCGVFNSSGSQRQQTVWECSEMDSELRRRLANNSKITINL